MWYSSLVVLVWVCNLKQPLNFLQKIGTAEKTLNLSQSFSFGSHTKPINLDMPVKFVVYSGLGWCAVHWLPMLFNHIGIWWWRCQILTSTSVYLCIYSIYSSHKVPSRFYTRIYIYVFMYHCTCTYLYVFINAQCNGEIMVSWTMFLLVPYCYFYVFL